VNRDGRLPESAPRLPNTIEHTLTAVPRSAGMRSLAPVEDGAVGVPGVEHGLDGQVHLLQRGSCGKSLPVWGLDDALERVDQVLQVGGVRGRGRCGRPWPSWPRRWRSRNARPRCRAPFLGRNIWIKGAGRSPRRNRSLPACLARPWTDSSDRPMFRTVSIMPGMENFAPDLTLTSSGSARVTELAGPSDCSRGVPGGRRFPRPRPAGVGALLQVVTARLGGL